MPVLSAVSDVSELEVKKEETKKVTYKPLFARVLIKRDVHKKIGNVLLPENIAQRHAHLNGIVMAVGPTADESIKIGDRVMFGRNAGAWLDASYSQVRDANGRPVAAVSDNDDGSYFICQDEDLLAVIE